MLDWIYLTFAASRARRLAFAKRDAGARVGLRCGVRGHVRLNTSAAINNEMAVTLSISGSTAEDGRARYCWKRTFHGRNGYSHAHTPMTINATPP